jgi:hypothetical protein
MRVHLNESRVRPAQWQRGVPLATGTRSQCSPGRHRALALMPAARPVLSNLADMTAGSGQQLDDLCQNAGDAARARGHDLGDWAAPPGQEDVARTAACRRCGRAGYVRAESGFAGAAGELFSEPCVESSPA